MCRKCGMEKALREFSPRTDGVLGRHSHCRKCRRAAWARDSNKNNLTRRAEYKNNPKKRAQLAAATARYRLRNKLRLEDYARAANRKRRLAVIAMYGGACECCGESRVEFLSIDHVDGDGASDRQQRGGSSGVYRALLAAGERLPKYRVLCHNCNMSLGFYGYCPHNAGN